MHLLTITNLKHEVPVRISEYIYAYLTSGIQQLIRAPLLNHERTSGAMPSFSIFRVHYLQVATLSLKCLSEEPEELLRCTLSRSDYSNLLWILDRASSSS